MLSSVEAGETKPKRMKKMRKITFETHFIETAQHLLICFNSLRGRLLEAGAESLTSNLGWEGDDHEDEE